MKSSAVCLKDVWSEKMKIWGECINSSSISFERHIKTFHFCHCFCFSPWVSPFTCEGGVAGDGFGRHVIIWVRAVEEGLSSLALGKGGVQGEAWTLQTQWGVTRWHTIFCFVTGAWWKEKFVNAETENRKRCKLAAKGNEWVETKGKLCVNLSASACVMEMRGGMRRGRVVGRDTLFRTSGERVRSRGRSQQGTCWVRSKC